MLQTSRPTETHMNHLPFIFHLIVYIVITNHSMFDTPLDTLTLIDYLHNFIEGLPTLDDEDQARERNSDDRDDDAVDVTDEQADDENYDRMSFVEPASETAHEVCVSSCSSESIDLHQLFG